MLQAQLVMDAAKQQWLLEHQLAARRAQKHVKMEQNNAKERELVREGQAEGGSSLVDEQASTNSFEARAKAAAARREEEEKLGPSWRVWPVKR
jgi:hypothetical protein